MEDMRELSKPFGEEEIEKVIDGMKKGRVAGCDGFLV